MDIVTVLSYFIIYAFLGWCTEVAFAAVVQGRFVNRGFLNGPVCPIYGFGMLIIIAALRPVNGNLFLLFLSAVLLTSALEWITGFVLERLFHEKWWDYSDMPCNLNGYICLGFSLLWGLAGVFVIKLIHPMIAAVVRIVPHTAETVILAVCFTVLAVDIALTVTAIMKIKRHTKHVDELERRMRGFSDGIGEYISGGVVNVMKKMPEWEETFEELKQSYKNNVDRRLSKRLLKAYPNLKKLNKAESLERIKRMISTIGEKIGKER